VVATLMWGYLYGPDFGPAAQLASKLHIGAPSFLGNTLLLPSIANVVTWEFTGYNMIILYAALRTVPRELYEAASVDGASAWRVAWHIKIPALRPALLLTLIFSVIGSFQLFTEPNLLQAVAPTVIGASYTPNLYAYSLTFTSQEPDYAAAVSFLLGLVTVAVSYVVLYGASRRSRR
jgi:multiple sugar transport system permease protein